MSGMEDLIRLTKFVEGFYPISQKQERNRLTKCKG